MFVGSQATWVAMAVCGVVLSLGWQWECFQGMVLPAVLGWMEADAPLRTRWDFIAVTDRDHESRHATKFEWEALFVPGVLVLDPVTRKFSIALKPPLPMRSKMAYQNRSMELSALDFYQDELLAWCDRSGLVFTVDFSQKQVMLRTLLRTGSGRKVKPFKTEWSALKDGVLYVGSTGKEWTDKEVVTNEDLKWVKTLGPDGRIRNINWKPVFDRLRRESGSECPGYMVHEAVAFDARSRQWVFAPRKWSAHTPYADETDVLLSSNKIFLVSEDLKRIRSTTVGPLEPEWGFTSIKPLPFSAAYVRQHPDLPSYYIGIKARELLVAGEMVHSGSKMVIFDLEGNVYTDSEDGFVPFENHHKFEAVAFIPGEMNFETLVHYQETHGGHTPVRDYP